MPGYGREADGYAVFELGSTKVGGWQCSFGWVLVDADGMCHWGEILSWITQSRWKTIDIQRTMQCQPLWPMSWGSGLCLWAHGGWAAGQALHFCTYNKVGSKNVDCISIMYHDRRLYLYILHARQWWGNALAHCEHVTGMSISKEPSRIGNP